MSNGTAPVTVGQWAELVAAVVRALPREIDAEQAQRWIENGDGLKQLLSKTLLKPPASDSQVVFTREVCQKVYALMGMEFDESLLVEPAPGF